MDLSPACVRPRRLRGRFTVPVRAPLLLIFRMSLFPLAATGHAIRVVVCVYVLVYGGAGPCSCTPGMAFFFFPKGGKCSVQAELELTGMHTASRAGEEALAAACFHCLSRHV